MPIAQAILSWQDQSSQGLITICGFNNDLVQCCIVQYFCTKYGHFNWACDTVLPGRMAIMSVLLVEQSICKVFLLYLYLWPSGYYYCRRIRNSSFPRQTLECSIVPRKACEADHQLWHKIPNKWRQLASNWSRTISFQSAAINMAQVVGCSCYLDQSMIKLCFTKAIPSRSTSRRL